MKLFLAAILLVLEVKSMASSRVIRDNRLKDLGTPPALARGYSVATNTYQSICMKTVETTKPSYNMKYQYRDIEKDWESSYKVDVSHKTSFDYLFLKGNVKVHTEVSGENTYHWHYIYTNIEVDSYYNSINEARSTLSDSAKDLLKKGDVASFFSSCGPYYIRSIGRHSGFLGLLSYRTKSSERDVNFELELKARMRGFFTGGGSTQTDISTDFKKKTEEKRLNIVIWGNGLGKDHLADLIPTDIDSFKESIQQVIKTMQDASTGIVTSMEVTPWVENTEFQDSLNLRSDAQKIEFKARRNLQDNSELIAELSRVDRAQTDQYFKALNCRRVLEEEYNSVTGDFSYNPEKTFFSDLFSRGVEKKEISLARFNQVLTSDTVQKYLDDNTKFLYGGSQGGNEGAINCMDELNEKGTF